MIDPRMFPPVPHRKEPGAPGLVSGYDLDANVFVLPPHVRALPFTEQVAWAREHKLQPTKETEALHAEAERLARGRTLFGTFLDKAELILRSTRERVDPLGLDLAAAYSMFEMMQPFINADAPAVTAAAETILSQATVMTLPAQFFSFAGKVLWLHGGGKQSNVVTTPGTYTFRLRYGSGVVGDTLLGAGGAIVPDPVAVTDNLFMVDLYVKAKAVGPLTTSLTLLAYGLVQMANSDASLASDKAKYIPGGGTSLADVASLDGTVAKTLTLTVTPTVATGSITLRDAWIVALN